MQSGKCDKDTDTSARAATQYRAIQLHLDGNASPTDGNGFRLCPLGVQFRSRVKAEPYAEMSIDVALPSNRADLPARKMTLTGIVVQCDAVADDEYKVAMYFVDLGSDEYELIRETAQCLPTLCPDCSLF